ncbi:MAG: methylenetetrahydrofolate reductase [Coriobacteriia bacterium]|nr:methylenetetrahydrofolate reductase [Coriobacteriia bacterium]MBN2839711.1 methylenetetrahydrofolate reductase [Coriobacteriia bacterium]
MSRLKELFDTGEFVVTGEVAPPRGTDLSGMHASVDLLAPYCHALNVTDNQGASLHLSSLAASRAILDRGIEPIFQQTCRDRNRLALQSDLLAAWSLGLENVLVVTGDDPRAGDHPHAKGVFDLDSTQLATIARGMNQGHDMMGRDLKGATDFYIGAAMFPEAEPWDVQLARIEQKIEAGVRFFQTQAIFDMDKLQRAVDAVRPLGAKVIAGVLVIRSPRVVKFVNEHLAGLMVPDHIAERISAADDPAEEAIALATEQVRDIRSIADGVHVMPLGLDAAVGKILTG